MVTFFFESRWNYLDITFSKVTVIFPGYGVTCLFTITGRPQNSKMIAIKGDHLSICPSLLRRSHTTLIELVLPLLWIPLQTDNSNANGILTNRINPKATEAMDVRFHWLRYRDAQGHFRSYWWPRSTNMGDYWTKQHTAVNHISFRTHILVSQKDMEIFRCTCTLRASAKGTMARMC